MNRSEVFYKALKNNKLLKTKFIENPELALKNIGLSLKDTKNEVNDGSNYKSTK